MRHFGIYSRFFKYDSMGALSLLIKFMFESANKNTTEYISFFNVCWDPSNVIIGDLEQCEIHEMNVLPFSILKYSIAYGCSVLGSISDCSNLSKFSG